MTIDAAMATFVEDLLARVRLIVREEVRVALAEPSGPSRAPVTPPAMFLTPRDVASTIGVTEPTVREWIRRGELPASRIGTNGRRLLVSRADLDAYVARQSSKPAREADLDRLAASIVSLDRARASRATRRKQDG